MLNMNAKYLMVLWMYGFLNTMETYIWKMRQRMKLLTVDG